jgi:hypothetical protein
MRQNKQILFLLTDMKLKKFTVGLNRQATSAFLEVRQEHCIISYLQIPASVSAEE